MATNGSCTDFTVPPAPKGYVRETEIGRGGCAIVYKGKREKDEKSVAIKYIPKNHIRECIEVDGRKISMEVYLMQRVAHIPGCIHLLDYYVQDDCLIIVTEKPEISVDMFEYLNRHKGRLLSETEARHFFKQLVTTLIAVHKTGVIHGDIKEENLLVDLETKQLKLIDFGGGHQLSGGSYDEFLGTMELAPPEFLSNKAFDALPLTVWSLGTLLHTMVCGRHPFRTEQEILRTKVMSYPFLRLTKALRSFLVWMLSRDPYDRPSLNEILQHPWMLVEVESKEN